MRSPWSPCANCPDTAEKLPTEIGGSQSKACNGERVETRKPFTSAKHHCCVHSICAPPGVHLEELLHLLWLAPGVCTPCDSEPMDRPYCGSHLVWLALSMAPAFSPACTCCGSHLVWLTHNTCT